LCSLARGQRPYGGLSAEQSAVYVLNGGRLERPENCPHRLHHIITSCWRHQPRDRPTASQLAQRLYQLLDQSQPSSAVTSSVTSSVSSTYWSSSCGSQRCPLVKRTWTEDDADTVLDEPSLSSSNTSTTTASADDLLLTSRANKIRQSLRKLVNVRA